MHQDQTAILQAALHQPDFKTASFSRTTPTPTPPLHLVFPLGYWVESAQAVPPCLYQCSASRSVDELPSANVERPHLKSKRVSRLTHLSVITYRNGLS
jgi:hypothetical protein